MRRLRNIQKCNSTAVSQRHFFGWGGKNFFYVLFLLVNLGSWSAIGQTPDYVHNSTESKNLDDFNITVADAVNVEAKINRLIIAVEVGPDGQEYVLTFGNGIKKVGANGGLVDFIPNTNNRLSNAMDFAINNDGKFFVATNESNRRFIHVYSPGGNYLQNETLGDGSYGTGANKFKGPVGLTFDKDDNLYVADHYIGTEDPTRPSAIKIYQKDSTGSYKNNLMKEFDNVNGTLLNFPYRIAVNRRGELYMSELGQDNNAKIRIIELDANFNPLRVMDGPSSNLGAPGSIIIDKFGYLYVADFGNEIDLPRLLAATGDIDEFYAVFEIIKEGIRNDAFIIHVYNPDNSYHSTISTEIDFPIDFAISSCGTLHINNAVFDGEIRETCIFGFCVMVPDITVDFDLEAFDRSSGYDTEAPEIISCLQDQEEEGSNGAFTLLDYRNLAEFSDNCDDDLSLIQDPPAGTSITEDTTIKIWAIDDSENESEKCTFSVLIQESSDSQDPTFTYCDDQSFSATAGECGTNVNYTIPTASDDSGEVEVEYVSGATYGSYLEVGESSTVVFSATDDAGNSTECSFTITVTDDEAPKEVTCPESLNFTVPFGETGRVVSYQEPTFEDNCEVVNIERTEGPSSGETFSLGETTVTYVATDAAGKTATCNFTVNITETADNIDPEITCPQNIIMSADSGECGTVVTYSDPTATDNSGVDPQVRKTGGPDSGTFFGVGDTIIYFEAVDGAGNTATCTLTITVEDEEAPTFSDCPETITAAFEITEGFEVEDYSQFFPASDNCSGNINYSQNPEPGTIIFTGGDHPVILTATDAAENSASCEFNLQLTEMNTLSLNCTREIRVPASENCEFILPDLSEEFIYFPEEAQISQSIASGEVLTEDTEVVITATYGDRTETCRIRIELVDHSWPELTCPTIQNVTVAPSEGFVLPDYISQIEATDNCGIVNIVQDPAPGTTVTEDVIVTITAEDTFGNFRDCFIYVYLQEDEEGLQISCPADQTLDLEGECSIAIPDYTGLASYSEGANISQSPPAGTSISEETEITLTATLDGEVETCTFNVQLVNSPELIVHCLQDHSEEPDENGYFTLPDYTIFANVEGNCGTPTYTQHPTAGTVVNEDTRITLTATEGNKQDSCDFLVSIQDPGSPASLTFTSCPEDTTEEMDADCQFALPDYTVEAQTNDPDAVISQVPPAGTVVNQDTQITLTATAGSQTATCSFHFDVIDNTPPVAVCVGEFELFLNEDGYGVLSAEIIDDGSYDNCGSFLMTLSKTRFELSDVGEQPVTLTVTDASGNTATCETVVTVSSTDAGVTCPEEMTLALDENGEYNLQLTYSGDEDNIEVEVSKSQFTCADVGRQQTITATYLGEHTGSCEIYVTVVDNIPPVISCLDEMEVRLNASGTASISSEDLNIEYSDNCGVANTSLSRLDFTTADVGVNEVTFTVTDGSGNESTCTTRVNVLPHEQGQTEPIKCVDLHVIQIGENGRAVLNPRDLFSGGSGTAQFEVSENTFTCSDLGENTITLNYSTPTEEGSCEITVLVEDPSGVCEEPTSPSNGDYIILYPNPSDGIVRFQTSPGLEIHRVEVFDMRGRFLFERAYDSVRIFDEKLDLREYQSGVYSILIHTNTREFLKRAIIRN